MAVCKESRQNAKRLKSAGMRRTPNASRNAALYIRLFLAPKLLPLPLPHRLFPALRQQSADMVTGQKHHHANRNEGDHGDC